MKLTHTHRYSASLLALACAGAMALSACSKSDSDPSPSAVASAPTPVAVAPVPAPQTTTTSVAPARTVVAQNDFAYDQGRRDQRRSDDRHDRSLPPRADRDTDVAQPTPQQLREARREHQQVAAAACPNCGVVEAIDAVKVEGQTNGVGAVAGGVGGAVLGNRIAGGGNRTLGGIVGAVGGGLVGNAIEKHERTRTVYDVRVRMNDGSLRTVRATASPAVGEKVLVESDGLHART